jgi:hypothetical protein
MARAKTRSPCILTPVRGEIRRLVEWGRYPLSKRGHSRNARTYINSSLFLLSSPWFQIVFGKEKAYSTHLHRAFSKNMDRSWFIPIAVWYDCDNSPVITSLTVWNKREMISCLCVLKAWLSYTSRFHMLKLDLSFQIPHTFRSQCVGLS